MFVDEIQLGHFVNARAPTGARVVVSVTAICASWGPHLDARSWLGDDTRGTEHRFTALDDPRPATLTEIEAFRRETLTAGEGTSPARTHEIRHADRKR